MVKKYGYGVIAFRTVKTGRGWDLFHKKKYIFFME
jgi:hypothetical protein